MIRPATEADVPELVAMIRELAEYEHLSEPALSSGHPAEKKLVQQDGRVRKLSSWKPQESSGGSGSVFAKVVDFGLHK